MNYTRHIMLSMVILVSQGSCMVAAPPAPPPQAPARVQAAGAPSAASVPPPGAACVGWRQTGGCSATGDREPSNDKACDADIESGWSGFCECVGGVVGADCNHPANNCNNVCRQALWSEAPPPAAPRPGAACVGWRQTGGCSAKGDREPSNDKACDVDIESGWSGFCECVGGVVGVGCNHPQNNCANVCRQALWSEAPPPPPVRPGSACVSWRQTGGCSATGPREPSNDKSCDARIESGWSGYCECEGGGRVGLDCNHSRGTCAQACRAAAWRR